MADSLKDRTITGVIWSGIQRAGSIILSFVSGIILARLLTPEDYGCIGMLAIFIAISLTFIDGGFGSALIQKKRPTDEDYSTIFYWNLGLSFFIYAILYISAPLIARFYHTEILSSVLRVQGIVLIINAARIVQFNQLRKQLRFKVIASIDVSVSAVSLALTILLAWKGFGVWSLVCQQLSVSVLSAIAYWAVSGWKPKWIFSRSSFRELFGFGGFILLSNLINTFCNNIQGLLIGRFYSPASMGYYSKAKGTEELSSTFISQIMEQVAYPVLSEAQNDHDYMIRMLKRFTGVLAYMTFPLMFLMILLAKPIFILLYSDKWLPSVPYFQILCIAGIAICLQGITYFAVAALGKSKSLFKWTLVKRGLGLLFIFIGLYFYGINGLLIGMALTSWLIYIINATLVHSYVGYKLQQQFLDLLPVILTSLTSFAASFLIGKLTGVASLYGLAVINLVIFAITYLSTSVLFRLESWTMFIETLVILLKKIKH